MLVKLPTWLSTLLKASGRSQATVNAANAAGADAANRTAGRIVRELVALRHFGQHLVEQEAGVLIAERIVLEAAIAVAFFLARLWREIARIDEQCPW